MSDVLRFGLIDNAQKRNEEVVRELERLLERAQRGEITDMCYVLTAQDAYEVGRTNSIIDAVGLSAMLHYRFLRQLEA